MIVRIELPVEIEQRLLAEVRAGRHGSVEEAILEKLSHNEDADLVAALGMDPQHLRRDLDDAWKNRGGAVDGDDFMRRHRAQPR